MSGKCFKTQLGFVELLGFVGLLEFIELTDHCTES
jgi:hypothetical protein